MTPLFASVTFNCFLIGLYWSVTDNTGVFDVPSRRGVRFVPERIAPAMRSMVFCSFIWEAWVIKITPVPG